MYNANEEGTFFNHKDFTHPFFSLRYRPELRSTFLGFFVIRSNVYLFFSTHSVCLISVIYFPVPLLFVFFSLSSLLV